MDAADSLLAGAGALADGAEAVIVTQANPAAAAASAAVNAVQTAIGDAFGAGGYLVEAHPWIEGLGRGDGLWRSLDAPRLARRLRDKLLDGRDPKRPDFGATPVSALALIAGGASPSLLLESVRAIDAVLSLKDFGRVRQRIERALRLEAERTQRPPAPKPPPWRAWRLRDIGMFSEVEQAVNSQLSQAQAYDDAAEAGLKALKRVIDQKQKRIQNAREALANALAWLQGGISGANAYVLQVSGTSTEQLASALSAADGLPGADLSFCAGVLIVAPDPLLDLPAALLGA